MRKKFTAFMLATLLISSNSLVFTSAGPNSSGVVEYSLEKDDTPSMYYVEDSETSEQSVEAYEDSGSVVQADSATSSSSVSASVSAYSTTSGFVDIIDIDDNGVEYTLTVNYSYVFNGEPACQVTNVSKDTVCEVTVPAYIDVTINGVEQSLPVRSIGESAFETAKCTSVTLPETVREIGTKAFMSCLNLKTVTINGEVLATGADGAIIESNLDDKGDTIDTVIGDNAFSNCTALENVYISGFQTMGDYLFSNCTSLKSVIFTTEGMVQVDNSRIDSNGDELLMTIGTNSFDGCTSIEVITLPKNLKTIGRNAFNNCSSLKVLEVGPTTTGTLSVDQFNGCVSMENVNVDAENGSFCSIGGILYKGAADDPSTLLYCPVNNMVGDLILPVTVTSIDDSAVMGNKNIISLTIQPEDITKAVSIGDSAFEGCTSLKTLNIDCTVGIGNRSFFGCSTLSIINHPYNMNTIGSEMGGYAFSECNSLSELTLGSWESMGDYAFANCAGLTALNCDYGVGTFGDYLFSGCTSLRTADLADVVYGCDPDGNYTFGTYVFKDCGSLETVDFVRAVDGISTGTFQNCTSLRSVTSADDIADISNLAFDNCTSLVEAPEPRFLVCIDENAFNGCTSLANYTMTRSVMKINENAFAGCSNLTISAPEGSKANEFASTNGIPFIPIADDIQDGEFLVYDYDEKTGDIFIAGYRGGFETLTIPDNCPATKLGYTGEQWINNPVGRASHCTMKDTLKYIDLGPVTEIYPNAFNGSALEAVNLRNVEAIDNQAFNNCDSLTAVTIPGTVNTIGSSVFSGCDNLAKVVFEDSVDGTPLSFTVRNSSSTNNKSTAQFRSCKNLNVLELSNNVEEIPEDCFYGCTSLESFEASNTIRTIGDTAFRGCTALTNLKFSPNTASIGEEAFLNCTALTQVTLQHNTFLGLNAFKGCTAIERIIIPQTANVAISNSPFVDTYNATVICVENSKGEEYARAFNDPVQYQSLFTSPSVAQSYEGKYNYTIEYGEFLEGVDYTILKGKIEIPEGITVMRDGVQLTNTDYVIGGDVLTISTNIGDDVQIFVNGAEIPNGGTYTVVDNENVIITYTDHTVRIKYGDVDNSGTVTSNDASCVLTKVLNNEFELAVETLTEDWLQYADVDASGTLTSNDCAYILAKTLDASFEFPGEN